MALRLAFMGTPDFAVPTLAELIAQGHDIAPSIPSRRGPRGAAWRWSPGPSINSPKARGLTVRTRRYR